MDQQDDRGRSTDSEQLQTQQQQQQRGQQIRDQDGSPASYDKSGAPADLEHGQSSVGGSGLDRGDSMIQANRASQTSTVAQRSGGQSEGGKGMGNESFEGSSLGGQSGLSDPARAPVSGEQLSDGHRDPAKPSTLDGE